MSAHCHRRQDRRRGSRGPDPRPGRESLMAKKSKIAANERRRLVVARFALRRAELKEIIRTGTPEEKAAAVRELARQPRDASATRVRNRDSVDGRPRGHLTKFGISRIRFREMAHRGELPGITKASW
ncbi:30S ribosomal protein S14 [Acrocarpospora pleiomorpha]